MMSAAQRSIAREERPGSRAFLSGFTLIEMLIVLAILGIIGTVSVSTFIQEARNAAVRQAAIQLQADLETLRSSTIRYNRNSFITLNTDGKGYVLTIADGAGTRTVSRTLSDGIVATRTNADVIYKAPLSVTAVSAPPLVYTLTLSGRSFSIKVIGVTGRAVFSAS